MKLLDISPEWYRTQSLILEDFKGAISPKISQNVFYNTEQLIQDTVTDVLVAISRIILNEL